MSEGLSNSGDDRVARLLTELGVSKDVRLSEEFIAEALGLLADHPSLDRAYGVSIYFCLLDDLKQRGPFAPIFYKLGEREPVNWLGQSDQLAASGAASHSDWA
jgi:hypothetical protein